VAPQVLQLAWLSVTFQGEDHSQFKKYPTGTGTAFRPSVLDVRAPYISFVAGNDIYRNNVCCRNSTQVMAGVSIFQVGSQISMLIWKPMLLHQ
jgi:hypothetical protein